MEPELKLGSIYSEVEKGGATVEKSWGKKKSGDKNVPVDERRSALINFAVEMGEKSRGEKMREEGLRGPVESTGGGGSS